jgi:hypothetical protein
MGRCHAESFEMEAGPLGLRWVRWVILARPHERFQKSRKKNPMVDVVQKG